MAGSSIATWKSNDWMYQKPVGGAALQGSTRNIQGSSPNIQGNSRVIQGSSPKLQVTTNPGNITLRGGSPGVVLGAKTSVDGAPGGGGGVDPAAAQAAADAARAQALRGEVTNLIGSIKDIFNARYGQAQDAAQEQRGSLSKRFANESQDLTRQITSENELIGAGAAAQGTFDSSYRGNNVDTVTREGESQISKLGDQLEEDLSAVGSWLSQQETGVQANKKGLDRVLKRLAESTDPDELTSLRNTLESRITELEAQGSDNQTKAQSRQQLEKVAPSSARAVQLQTTLSQIANGNADAGLKRNIGQRLIANSGISGAEKQKILDEFSSQLDDDEQQ